MTNERNSKFVPTEAVEKALEAIRKKPKVEPEKMSFRCAIEKMYPEIKKSLDEGHTFESVLNTLHDCGIDISIATLRAYIYQIKNAEKDNAEKQGDMKEVEGA